MLSRPVQAHPIQQNAPSVTSVCRKQEHRDSVRTQQTLHGMCVCTAIARWEQRHICAQASDWPCRPRERIHRPQTRRRKENNEEAMDKMRAIQGNLTKARELVEQLLRRERKKRDIVVRAATGPPSDMQRRPGQCSMQHDFWQFRDQTPRTGHAAKPACLLWIFWIGIVEADESRCNVESCCDLPTYRLGRSVMGFWPCCCPQYAQIDAQQLQVKQRHEPRSALEAIEADYSAAARAKPGRRPLGFEVGRRTIPGAPASWAVKAASPPACCQVL